MELSLDLSLNFFPQTISDIFAEISSIRENSKKLTKLEDYVKGLEDEMRKVEAFKRELPLCMLLLNDVILRLKEELVQLKELENQPVTDETRERLGDFSRMSSAQLRSNNDSNFINKKKQIESDLKPISEEADRSVPENPVQQINCRKRINKFESNIPVTELIKEDKEISQVPCLSLMTIPSSDLLSANLNPKSSNSNKDGVGLFWSTDKLQIKSQQQQQAMRKHRRCWSPELHRRFIDALKRLGGSQAATPKQIRELMQVEGLTNDEVKSHLQKYRLHIRKLPHSEATANGVWTSLGQTKTSNQSGSPQGPLLAGGLAKDLSATEGDSMEGEEDEKSDSHSWKDGILTYKS